MKKSKTIGDRGKKKIIDFATRAVGKYIGGGLAGPIGEKISMLAIKKFGELLFVEKADPGIIAKQTVLSFGSTIPIVYGTMQIGGNVIWISKPSDKLYGAIFGQTSSVAIAICEGPIDRINQILMDGTPLKSLTYRQYLGTEDQKPDPLIEKSLGIGKTPAYRGLCYVVIEDVVMKNDKLPEFQFCISKTLLNQNFGTQKPVEQLIKGVNITSGMGEFAFDTRIQRKIFSNNRTSETINANQNKGEADAIVAVESMLRDFPNLEWIAVAVHWFANSLDAATANLYPGVEFNDVGISIAPDEWTVGEFRRANSHLIGNDNGIIRYGGTPDDSSLVRFLKLLQSKGLKITLLPLLMMDVANKPWRGHLKSDSAAGLDVFFAKYSKYIKHYATLTRGLVDAFLIGSEMKGITTAKYNDVGFYGVLKFVSLAKEVREIFNSQTKKTSLSYCANWDEYHHVASNMQNFKNQKENLAREEIHSGKEGESQKDNIDDQRSGVFNDKKNNNDESKNHESIQIAEYHLDALWADPSIDFVGISAYFPLMDREESERGFSVSELQKGWSSRELIDYVYDSDGKKNSIGNESQQIKNLVNWWDSYHKMQDGQNSAWSPRLKKIWFVEYGFASVNGAANQPSKFIDFSSSDGGYPKFSDHSSSLISQRRAIEATLRYFEKSPAVENLFLAGLDIRPFPTFPTTNIWSDGKNWEKGHWIQGKLGKMTTGAIYDDLIKKCGINQQFITRVGMDHPVEGLLINRQKSCNDILKNLQELFDFDVFEQDGMLYSNGLDGEIITIDDSQVVDGPKFETNSENVTQSVSISYVSKSNNLKNIKYPAVSVADRNIIFEGVLSDEFAEIAARRISSKISLNNSTKLRLLPSVELLKKLRIGSKILLKDQVFKIITMNTSDLIISLKVAQK